MVFLSNRVINCSISSNSLFDSKLIAELDISNSDISNSDISNIIFLI